MTLLIGSLIIGLILSLLALGVLVSFRIFSIRDLTTDGSITLGASIAAVLLVQGTNPIFATIAGALGGAVAGMTTGFIHTKFKVNAMLAGILVMTALYSVNLNVMGRSNVPLMQATTVTSYGEKLGEWLAGGKTIHILGWPVAAADATVLILALGFTAAAGGVMFAFFRTQLGTSLRATGDNPQMIRALGANVERNIILGLGLSNGLVALSGALLAQYQGFADAQMGIGMIVWGLASVIIGEALTNTRSLGLTIVGTIMGSVLFRLLVAIALRWGLNPNNLKLITALFVLAALILPGLLEKMKRRPKSAT
ncbi:ABC transporter permease [Prosthecobacter sp.]|uniref:ABC transporter permease n=1 Tax=Prosthecobacter sp. TaxID=1965333 RepID=UPI003784EAAF